MKIGSERVSCFLSIFHTVQPTIAHLRSPLKNFKLPTEKCGPRFNCRIIYNAKLQQIENSDVLIIHPVFTALEIEDS